MTTHISLLQMALSAGAEEELDTTDIEVICTARSRALDYKSSKRQGVVYLELGVNGPESGIRL